MQLSIRRLLFRITVIALAIWFVGGVYLGFVYSDTGESVASVDWLPESASNVSYYRSYINSAYEFDIDEAGFRKWAQWDVSEVTEPVRLWRYLLFSTPFPQEPPNPTEEEMDAFALAYSRLGVTIRDGLYYGYTRGNGGGVWVGYDRRSGRAYYQSAAR